MIVKFLSNKTKTRILTKRRQLKGKPLVILEDIASDLAKRLIESAWISNGKTKYKLKDNQRVKEIQSWQDVDKLE